MGGDLDRLIPGDNKQNADIVCSAVRAYLSAPESDIKKKARADGRMIAKTPIAAIRGLYDYRANGLRPPVEVVGRAAAGAGAAPAASPAPAALSAGDAAAGAGAAPAASPAPAAALSAGDAAAGAGAGAPAAFPVPRAVASRASRTGNSYLLPSSSFPAGSSRSGAHFVRGGKRKSKTIRKHKSKRHTKRKRNQK